MSTVRQPWISPEEYRARERVAEFRSGYRGGEIFATAGGSPRRSLIGANTIATLNADLRGRPCAVYTNDLRIRISATGLFTYPDARVIGGKLTVVEGLDQSMELSSIGVTLRLADVYQRVDFAAGEPPT